MAITSTDYLRTAYPPPLVLPTGIRRFHLSWDNSKAKTRNARDTSKLETQFCTGVLFPPSEHIRVALGTGATYETLNEMEIQLELTGNYDIRWEDDEA